MKSRSVLLILLYIFVVITGSEEVGQAQDRFSDRYRLYQVIGPEGPPDIYESLRNSDTIWQLLCARNFFYHIVRVLTSREAEVWIRGDTFYVFAGFVLKLKKVDANFLVEDCIIYSVFTDSSYNILGSTAIDTTCVLRDKDLRILSDSLFRYVEAESYGTMPFTISFSVDIGLLCKNDDK